MCIYEFLYYMWVINMLQMHKTTEIVTLTQKQHILKMRRKNWENIFLGSSQFIGTDRYMG